MFVITNRNNKNKERKKERKRVSLGSCTKPFSLPASVCWRCDLLFKKDKLTVCLWFEQVEWKWRDGLREEWCRKKYTWYNPDWTGTGEREGGQTCTHTHTHSFSPYFHPSAHQAAQPKHKLLCSRLSAFPSRTHQCTTSLSLSLVLSLSLPLSLSPLPVVTYLQSLRKLFQKWVARYCFFLFIFFPLMKRRLNS